VGSRITRLRDSAVPPRQRYSELLEVFTPALTTALCRAASRDPFRSVVLTGECLSGSTPRNARSDEAGIDGDVYKASDACHALGSSLSGLKGLATVPKLRMSRSSLDRLCTAGAVKSANWHSVGARVKTATSAAFRSRFALRGPTGGYVG
jgi:hypothetical protein